jgi:exonuclease V gamma subunit
MEIAFSENINDDLCNWRSGLAASNYGVQWRELLSASVPATALRNEDELETYLRKAFYEREDIADFQKWHFSRRVLIQRYPQRFHRALSDGQASEFRAHQIKNLSWFFRQRTPTSAAPQISSEAAGI